MTHQLSNNLVCRHPRINLSGYEIDSEYYSPELHFAMSHWSKCPTHHVSSNLWRGFLATFRLNENGTFELVCLEYPDVSGSRQDFNIVYGGDFFVAFQIGFGVEFSSKTIPFENGKIVEDQSTWQCDEPFQPTTVFEFRSAPISRARLGFESTKICEELGIKTIGDLEDMRLQFETHPKNANKKILYSIDYILIKGHLKRRTNTRGQAH